MIGAHLDRGSARAGTNIPSDVKKNFREFMVKFRNEEPKRVE